VLNFRVPYTPGPARDFSLARQIYCIPLAFSNNQLIDISPISQATRCRASTGSFIRPKMVLTATSSSFAATSRTAIWCGSSLQTCAEAMAIVDQ